jgi:hypothetical protein
VYILDEQGNELPPGGRGSSISAMGRVSCHGQPTRREAYDALGRSTLGDIGTSTRTDICT